MISKKYSIIFVFCFFIQACFSQTYNWNGYPNNSTSWNPSSNFNVTTSTSGSGSFDRRSSTGTGTGLIGTAGNDAASCGTYNGLRLEMSGAGNSSGSAVWNNSITVTINFPNFICAPVTFNIYDITQTFYNDGSANYVYYQDKVTISALDNSNNPVIPSAVLNGAIDNTVAGNSRILTANSLNGQCKNQAITVGTAGQQIKQITVVFSNQDLPAHCPSPAGSPIRYGFSQYQYIFISPITGNPPPTASITSPALPCGSTATTLTGNTSASSPVYLWTGPSGSTVSSPNSSSTAVSGAGVYTLTINPGGCGATATYTLSATGSPPIVNASVSNTLSCSINTVQAIASTTSTPVTYNWSGSGIISGGTTSSPIINAAGIYNYTVTNTSSGCLTTGSVTVLQNNSVVNTNVTVSNSLSCITTTAQAIVSTTSTPVSYNWSGPGIISGANTSTAVINTPGTYNYTVTNTSNNCVNTGSVAVIGSTNNVTPTATANGSITCTTSTVALIGGPSALTYTWSGPGFSGGTNSQNAIATTAGSYTLIITSANGCTNSAVVSVPSNTIQPTVTTGTTLSLTCLSPTVLLSGSSSTSNVTYSWTGPTIGTLAGSTPSNSTTIVSAGGTYTLTVTDVNNGCINTALQTVISNTNSSVPVTPTITSSGNNLCAGQTATLTSSSSSNNLWSTSATTQSIVVNSSGVYSLTISDPSGCVTATNSITISINTTPINITLPPNQNVCNNDLVSIGNFTSTVPGTTYSWQNSNSSIGLSAIGTGTITPFTAYNNSQFPTNAIITITPTALGCSGAPQSFTITVNPNINVNAGANYTLCYGQSEQLNATPNNNTYTYNWQPTIGLNTANIANPIANPTVTTNYTLTVTDANGCTGTDEITLFTTSALLSSSSNTIFCEGTSAVINSTVTGGNSSNYQYNWQPSIGLSNSNILNPVANPSVTTIYTLTVSDGCSISSLSQSTVTVIKAPVVSIASSSSVGCAPLCVNFIDQSQSFNDNIISWQWTLENQVTSNLQNPQHCFLQSGDYAISLTVVSSNGCSSTQTFNNFIKVYPNPIADFIIPNEITVLSSDVQFYDQSINATSWEWLFNDPYASQINQTSYIKDPKHYFENQGTYCVNLKITNEFGCVDAKNKCLEIKPEFTIYVPNAFTPDNNKINDMFTAVGINIIEFEMSIFDRWGEEIFYTNDITKGWDGAAKKGPEQAKQDVYVWKIRALDIFNRNHNLIGSVTLLR